MAMESVSSQIGRELLSRKSGVNKSAAQAARLAWRADCLDGAPRHPQLTSTRNSSICLL